jgi:CrcB protein
MEHGHEHHRLEQVATALGAHDDLPLDPDLDVDLEAEEGPEAPLRPRRLRRFEPILAVAAGGWIGATGRYEFELAVPTRHLGFPVSTFLINTSGACLLGLLLTVSLERLPHSHRAALSRAFFGTGMLGGWTTMSTLAVEAGQLMRAGQVPRGLLYLVATLAAGFVGSAVGIAIGRRRELPATVTAAEEPS